MANTNIEEWSPEQVADWLSGVGPRVAQYAPELCRRGLNGARLLLLRCDDLDYLGVRRIGHQELILEAVDLLRNYHFERSRECVSWLAVRAGVCAGGAARAAAGGGDRLHTQALADTARTLAALKPLMCWLHRGPSSPLRPERRAALLRLALEAATSAQRERFADRPAASVAAAAAAIAAAAAHLLRECHDPGVLAPAALDVVTVARGGPLAFDPQAAPCGHRRLADVRVGAGCAHEGDELVAVGGRVVVGWGADALAAECARAALKGDLQLVVRRRGASPLAPPPPPPPGRARDRRLRLSPLPQYLASPLHVADLRAFKHEFGLRAAIQSSGAVAEGSGAAGAGGGASSSSDSEALSPPASPSAAPRAAPRPRPLRRHSTCGGSPPRSLHSLWPELSAGFRAPAPEPPYRRDKALSCGTGLAPPPPAPRRPAAIPEAPDAPAGRLLDFRKPSEQTRAAPQWGALKAVCRPAPPPPPAALKPVRGGSPPLISLPLRRVADLDARPVPPPRAAPAAPPTASPPAAAPHSPAAPPPDPLTPSPTMSVLSILNNSKTKTNKKKNSVFAKGRVVAAATSTARSSAHGWAWQRARGGGWTRRLLVLCGDALLVYAHDSDPRAAVRLRMPLATADRATEVNSKPHAFKVYRSGVSLYFAADDSQRAADWIQALQRATLLPDNYHMDESKQFSETDSDGNSDGESKVKEKDKSKFGSLKKLTHRMQRSESSESVRPAGASLDRKYLRFFSRNKSRDDSKTIKKSPSATLPPPPPAAAPPSPPSSQPPHSPLPAHPPSAPAPPLGFVTLEQFMLQRQEERRPASRLRRVRDRPANTRHRAGESCEYPHLQCPPTFEPEVYSLAAAMPGDG